MRWITAIGMMCGMSAALSGHAQTPVPAQSGHATQPGDAEAAIKIAVERGDAKSVDAQARALVDRDTHSAQAWAVVAMVSNEQGRLLEAIGQAFRAGELDDRDPFVQRAAGGVVGAYDGTKPRVPDRAVAQMNTLRHNMKGQAPYDEAYRAAKDDAAKQLAAAQAAAARAAPVVVAPIEDAMVASDGTPVDVTVITPPPVVNVQPSQTQTVWAGRPFVEGPWAAGPIVVLRDNRDHHGLFVDRGLRAFPPALTVSPAVSTMPSMISTRPFSPSIRIVQPATIPHALPSPPATNQSPFERTDRERR